MLLFSYVNPHTSDNDLYFTSMKVKLNLYSITDSLGDFWSNGAHSTVESPHTYIRNSGSDNDDAGDVKHDLDAVGHD